MGAHGLVQCTVDMPPEWCGACLDRLISAFPATFPKGRYGGRILVPRCTVRYETDDTFFDTANLSVDLHIIIIMRPNVHTPPLFHYIFLVLDILKICYYSYIVHLS